MINYISEITSSTAGFEILEERVNPTSTWKSLKIRGIFQRADSKNQNGRIYPYKVLEAALQEANEALVKHQMIGEVDHPCLLNDNFKVLTLNGWKLFKDIKQNDKVWSLQDGKAVVSNVDAIINQHYCGDAYTVIGQNINTAFTAPHKVLLNYRTDGPTYKNNTGEYKVSIKEIAENRKKYAHSPIPRTAIFDREQTKIFEIDGITTSGKTRVDVSNPLVLDAKIFSAFMGIYLAEGNLASEKVKGHHQIFISQKTPWTRQYIKSEILDKLSPEIIWNETKTGFQASDARLYKYLSKLGNAYTKFVPSEIKALDSSCLKELLFWFGIGDGRLVKTKQKNEVNTIKEIFADSVRQTLTFKYLKFNLFSVSEQLIDDLHECLVLAGLSGSKFTVITQHDYRFAGRIIKAENKVPLHVLNISPSKHIWLHKNLNIDKIQHNGNIYCLTTTHGNFYMEQNGKAFWTGNCDGTPIVSLKNASHVVTSLKFQGKDMIGEALVFDDPGPAGTPGGRILGALIRNNCTVGISSRGYGSVTENYDGTVVDQYKLVTFDAVNDPSTQKAFLEPVNENIDFNTQIRLEVQRKELLDSLRSEFSSMFKK